MGLFGEVGQNFNRMYNNAAYGEGWEERARQQQMSDKLELLQRQATLESTRASMGDREENRRRSEEDQQRQNMSQYLDLMGDISYGDPEAQGIKVDWKMPEGVDVTTLDRAGRARGARLRQRDTDAAERQTRADEAAARSAADAKRREIRFPYDLNDIKGRITRRDNPQPTDSSYQRDYSQAYRELTAAYKEGDLDDMPTPEQIAARADEIRGTRPTSGGASAGASQRPAVGGPKPQSGGVAQPRTREEYNALPSGSVYVDTDGKTKRKR